MKIRDLLAVESIDLNGKVTGKNEALDAMVALMAKSGKINDVEKYRKAYTPERKKEQPELVRESPFHIASQMQSADLVLQQWSSKTGWILMH